MISDSSSTDIYLIKHSHWTLNIIKLVLFILNRIVIPATSPNLMFHRMCITKV
jgi:hypothetical protein